MHNVFFGGIAQYYESNGMLIQDNNVPFVNTIARVTRDASGGMAEYKLPVEMPGLLGAGAEFIPILSVPHFSNEVFRLDDFANDTTLVGYIYGGISSSAPNIFFTNTGDQSSASSQIFKVYVIKDASVNAHDLNEQSTGTLAMQVYPNPNHGQFEVVFNLTKKSDVKISLFDLQGKLLEENSLRNLESGENKFQRNISDIGIKGTFIITLETAYERASQKIIFEIK
jgi:hypothetical protein